MRICVFDIETGPLPKERIEEIAPPFNENKIKTGNLGLEKALAKVNEDRANHIESIFDKAGRYWLAGLLKVNPTQRRQLKRFLTTTRTHTKANAICFERFGTA